MTDFKVGDVVYVHWANRWNESWNKVKIAKINKRFMEVEAKGYRPQRFQPDGNGSYPRNSNFGKILPATPENDERAKRSDLVSRARGALCNSVTNKWDLKGAPTEALETFVAAVDDLVKKCPLQQRY